MREIVPNVGLNTRSPPPRGLPPQQRSFRNRNSRAIERWLPFRCGPPVWPSTHEDILPGAVVEEHTNLSGLLAGPPILFATGFVGLVGSILLARNSNYGPWAAGKAVPTCWLIAAAIQAIASFGHALRGELPALVVFSAVNATQIAALSLLLLGARQMSGRRASCWLAVLPPVVWLAACLIPGFIGSQQIRLSLYVLLGYGTAIWTTIELLGIYRRQHMRAALDMAMLVGGVAAVNLTVVVHAIFFPRLPDGGLAIFTSLPTLMTALFGTTLPFMMLAVTREREALDESTRRAAALQAGRAEMERLHAGLPAVVFLIAVTIDGDTVRLDRRYRGGDTAAVVGWPPEDLAGLPGLGSIADYGEVSMLDCFRRTVETGAHGWEWRVRRKDGSWSWIRTRARRLARMPDGTTEVVGYSLNIDREREAEARALASARMASLGEMAASVAHEIRQPLQSISLAAEIAQLAVQRADAAAAEERLERIVEQTQRTSEIIEGLRRFARGAEDGAPLQAVPLEEAVQAVLSLVHGSLRDASIDVEVALGAVVPVVRGQPVLLEQVLSNLLLNARDALAAQTSSAARKIRIAATSGAEDTVRLTVADTGGGLAPAVAARLFEPFVTTKGPDKGTGLGLSICHGLIKGMGGRIEAHNDAEGAVFTITLPSATADKTKAGAGMEAPIA